MPAPVQYRGMALIVPDNDSEWKEYFAFARRHELRLRRCQACGLLRYPPTHAVVHGARVDVADGERAGTIYSYEIVEHAIQPGFKETTPYSVVLVELDEQRGRPSPDEAIRIVANLVTPDGAMEDARNVAIGKRVRAVFQDLAEHLALVQFTLTDEPPEGRVWRLPE